VGGVSIDAVAAMIDQAIRAVRPIGEVRGL